MLALTPSQLRLQLLRDILADDDGDTAPQMRVAAIGLVKEAVLEALSTPASDEDSNAFASPLFMRTFAPLVFSQRLPSIKHGEEDAEDDLEAFLESPEPLRLVESLGLYYVVLQRDVGNKVGRFIYLGFSSLSVADGYTDADGHSRPRFDKDCQGIARRRPAGPLERVGDQ